MTKVLRYLFLFFIIGMVVCVVGLILSSVFTILFWGAIGFGVIRLISALCSNKKPKETN